MTRAWTIRVLPGPHGAPDFFTAADIAMIGETEWKTHYNSNRTGVRLIGPKPEWARRDGGEAGLHPSNIHDNAYAIGAVDFTGDMPIILGPDGPSLGGFVCPFVVIHADLWKTGQLAPGDTVRFAVVTDAEAVAAEQAQDAFVATLVPPPQGEGGEERGLAEGKTDGIDNDLSLAVTNARANARAGAAVEGVAAHSGLRGLQPPQSPSVTAPPVGEQLSGAESSPILGVIEPHGHAPRVVYRRQGDRSLLVEYGPIVLDLELRLRVHALMLELQTLRLPGVIDITPGIRSLQVHYDSRILPQQRLLQALADAETRLGGLDDFEIPSRVVHLPLSWRDPAIYETINRYVAQVRDDAPWCPDNIEFIRRVNGLASVEDVHRIVFDARYLVMGLGDVYLGAPVATPIDPRHRLVTTKYNPARTWTPPNVVGIGGAYMCIYGMEGPGGYQLFGRTIQVWNSWRQTSAFREGKPWLLRFFDQIRFFPVTHEELTEWRRDFPLGRREIAIEEETFRLADYCAFLSDNDASIKAFEARRGEAFAAERADWEARGEFARVEALSADEAGSAEEAVIVAPDGCDLVEAPLGGSVWKMLVSPGDRVEKGAVIAVIEAMKTECDVPSPAAGIVRAVYAQAKQAIAPGAPMIALESA